MRGFLLTPTYRVVNGTAEVHLYGVLESGEACLIIDDRVRPYFFVRKTDAGRMRTVAPKLDAEECDLHSLDGDAVVRVHAATPADVPPLRQRLEGHGIPCFEADVRFAYRYLIDRGIRGAFEVGPAPGVTPTGPLPVGSLRAERLNRLRVFRNPDLRPAHWAPKLKVLSIDIETTLDGNQVYAIALHTPEFERVLIVHDHVLVKGEPVPSEKALIQRFLEYLHEIDPDVITGWNVVDFDLAVLSRAARRHGIRFAIGRNDEEFNLRKDMSYTRESRAVIFGRQVLDGLSLMRGAFIKLEDYKLETAAQSFLQRGKLLTGDGRHTEIGRLYREEPQRLVDYNLEDARLVTALLEKTRLIELAIERSLLTGMQLDRVSAAIASIDSLYLHNLRQRGFVAPSVGGTVTEESHVIGGYVMDSKPGLFRNVLVFDFKSLYPSIIRTFNLDPLTLCRDHPRVTSDEPRATAPIEAPNGALFRRDIVGIIPELLAHLAAERELAKSVGDGVKSNAIKILMNSFYGVLGASTSRLFFPAVASAVTTFGQRIIKCAAELARGEGYDVIYGDTDSLFVHPGIDDPKKALKVAEELRVFIGAGVARYVESLGCHSYLELEFEKMYTRFMMPEVRGSKIGSKKRYAGLLVEDGKEEIDFVGLEAVRRDWSEVSKNFQRQLLWRVFHDEPVEEFIKGFVAELRGGKYDGQLVYKKAIRKGLEAYTKTTPPHVKAARKQKGEIGRIIAYVMTENGPEPVEELTAPPDYPHYIEHQIAPIADAVLSLLGGTFEAIVPTKAQMSLF